MTNKIKLVVFDWAGTTVDHGCFAPVSPFVEALHRHGVEITIAQARGPMGLDKKDHLRALLALPEAAAQWLASHDGHDPNDADINRIYDSDLVPLAIESVPKSSRLIPGVLECVEELRRRDIKIATTTGYFTEAARLCYEAGARQGYVPDVNVCTSEVPAGRPTPWMIYRIMETLSVAPGTAVVKVGDTVPDIGEGLNAGAWTVGVAATGSDVGLSERDLAALPVAEREARVGAAREKLLAAGAHYVIDSVADLPPIIDEIEAR